MQDNAPARDMAWIEEAASPVAKRWEFWQTAAMERLYYPQLDGLRAIAVLIVLSGHFLPRGFINELFGIGDSGVVLFFVLSGFLITTILLDIRDRGSSLARLGQFYVRRFIRIVPIYLLTIIIAVAVGYEPVIRNLPRLLTYTATYVPGLHPMTTGLGRAAHFWSLSVEEEFYTFWPLIVLWLPPRFIKPTIVALISMTVAWKYYGVLHGASYGALFESIFSSTDSLGAGALLAVIVRERRASDGPTVRISPFAFIAVSLAILVITVIKRMMGLDAFYRGGEIVGVAFFHASAVACVLAVAACTSGQVWLLALAPLRWIGRISYGIYVYHFFVPTVLGSIAPWLTQSSLFTCYVLIVTFLVATASWYLIERPLLRWRASNGRLAPA